MPERYTRRDFLTGVVACGTLSAGAIYLLPGGRTAKRTQLTMVTGADSTGGRQLLIDMWNEANPQAPARAVVVTGETGDQRQEMIAAAQNVAADIVNLDTIHISQFASRNLIVPIEVANASVFVSRTLLANRVADDPNRYWAVPFNTDVGMLFERLSGAELAEDPPRLAEVIDVAASDGSRRFVGQLRPSSSTSEEAFVVNVLEHALSRDPAILDENGIPVYDLARWQAALDPLRAAIDAGRIALSDSEDDSLRQFTSEAKPQFMRNWPVKYRELQQRNDPDVRAARIRVAALPTGILGGQSLAVVSGSRNASAAAEFIRFLTDEPAQKVLAAHGLAPTRIAAYNDANLTAFIPHLGAIRGAVEAGRPRPIHANYSAFANAVVRHVRALLHENIDLPSEFVDDMANALR